MAGRTVLIWELLPSSRPTLPSEGTFAVVADFGSCNPKFGPQRSCLASALAVSSSPRRRDRNHLSPA